MSDKPQGDILPNFLQIRAWVDTDRKGNCQIKQRIGMGGEGMGSGDHLATMKQTFRVCSGEKPRK